MEQEEFRKLQRKWNQHLADTGFRDIEADGEPKEYRSFTTNKEDAEIHEEYFEALNAFIHDERTVWKREIDRRILTLYAEGARIKDICHALRIGGDSRGRAAVRFIIRKYEHAWMIRTYTRKQLHLRIPS